MDACRYFLCFAMFSFIGWAWECLYYSVQQRRLVNSGFLSTCFCPIYGIGALLDLIILGRIENTALLFFSGVLLTGTLEYFVSWLLETLFHRRWWDYTGWPLNINGRICILSVGLFGIATVALIKFVAPFTIEMIDSLKPFTIEVLSAVFAFVMLVDAVKSARHIDTERLWFVEKQEEFIANNRIVNAIKNTFRR